MPRSSTVDGAAIGVRANRDLDDFLRPHLILKDKIYRWWSTLLEKMLRDMKICDHVQGIVAVPRLVLTLSASATPAVPVIAMGVAAILGVASIAANGGVTQVQVDASRVTHDHYAVDEARANIMILLTLKQKYVMTLLTFPLAASKWTKLAADYYHDLLGNRPASKVSILFIQCWRECLQNSSTL